MDSITRRETLLRRWHFVIDPMRDFNRQVHVTDAMSYTQCRRRWNWASMMREGLQPAVIPVPLFEGQGVHVALDKYYSHPPEERTSDVLIDAFQDWVRRRTKKIQEYTGPLWSSDKEAIRDVYLRGSKVLMHYYLWAQPFDEDLRFVSTEQRFSVPVPVGGKLAARDSDVTLSGRFDGVVEDVRSGDYYLMEYKTTKSLYNLKWITKNLQSDLYVWAAKQLYGDRVKGIIYRGIVKRVPDDLIPLQQPGMYSQKQSQRTSLEWAKMSLEIAAIEEGIDVQEMFQAHAKLLTYLNTQSNPFFQQLPKSKSPEQLERALITIYWLGQQMMDPNVLIFPTTGWWCGSCPFFDVCTLMDEGGDWQGLLETEFAPRSYWEDLDDEEDTNEAS
ncbi:MAG: PD-(D/E)XK nuclease family protein [Clostridia bacterium]